MRYNNYHRHDHFSNIRTPDVIVKPQDYINRIKELGHTHYFTTNHGCSGNVFEAYDLCKKNDLKLVYGMEMYYVDDRFVQERENYHIVIIGLTKNAFHQINRISSEANKSGFYYRPRVDLKLLLSLPSSEVVITTACIGGRLFKTDDYIQKFLLPLRKHFGNNFLLETQAHVHPSQAQWNKQIVDLSNKYNIPIIHGCDSHYIYPEQAKDRSDFLKGKGMNYGDEDSFILDYPDYETILNRYKEQGVLTDEQAKIAIKNTLIFDNAEDLNFTKELKMPNVHGNKDKNKELQKIIVRNWHKVKETKPKELHDKYKEAIAFEMNIIQKTDMADYFLLNEKIINLAINKYEAVLTRTGRGSAPSFFINNLLGFTNIDRVSAEVPLYPTRFMSISRILESGQMPDIDFNFADVKPVTQASKDILGEDGVYYMIAYGTMQESGAFRNLCRAYGLEPNDYNEVAKNLDEYREGTVWSDLIEESKKFIGVIDSVAPSPCSFIILDKPISSEIGLIKIGDEICACIDGYTADSWGYLKNDYLTVDVWKIISDTFKLIKKPIPSIDELRLLIDDKVWKLYEDGITATLNQADSDFATGLIKKYKPKSIAEMSAFVAAIRPGFASLLNNFLNREIYSTGVAELDEVLEDSFHYLLYQESIMKMLVWCEIPEDQTYDIIKKIAKKRFDEEELIAFKDVLIDGFIKHAGSEDGFAEVWQVVEDAVQYSFNASHSYSMAFDSVYGAYLKANYPLEYYTVVLNHYRNDIDKTRKISSELDYFGIKLSNVKFRYSGSEYRYDKKTNSIYKGIPSIKFLNEQVANDLYKLKENKYNNFYELLVDLKLKTSINSKQLNILTTLNFFSEFGGNKKLLNYIELFDSLYDIKQLSKSKADKLKLKSYLLKDHSRETAKTYMDFDFEGVLLKLWNELKNGVINIKEQIKFEVEFLGYVETKEDRLDSTHYIVTEYKTYKYKHRPYVTLYQLQTGQYLKTKVVDSNFYSRNPFNLYDILKIKDFTTQKKSRLINNQWQKTDEDEQVLAEWQVL